MKHIDQPLSMKQLRRIATEFGLEVRGTMSSPKFGKLGKKGERFGRIWVVFDQERGTFGFNNWRYPAKGDIACAIQCAIEGTYPHPEKVMSMRAKIERLI